jgi:hypothetical protein
MYDSANVFMMKFVVRDGVPAFAGMTTLRG